MIEYVTSVVPICVCAEAEQMGGDNIYKGNDNNPGPKAPIAETEDIKMKEKKKEVTTTPSSSLYVDICK